MSDHGSSPRGRGTPQELLPELRIGRFIPAWAGNTGVPPTRMSIGSVHPRVGGEHGSGQHQAKQRGGSSPRGRGTQPGAGSGVLKRRFIPAWAGNTSGQRMAWLGFPVHPRVGGEHCSGFAAAQASAGSSPRGRGTLLLEPIDSKSIFRCQRTYQLFAASAGRRGAPCCHWTSTLRQRSFRPKGNQTQAVQVERNAPICTTGIELKTHIIRGRPSNYGVTIIDVPCNLTPDHLAHTAPISTHVNTGSHFQ